MTDRDEHHEDGGGDDIAAAEYVLGVLPAGERDDVARRIAADPAFARLVASWEDRLAGMNAAYGEAEPPARVFRDIQSRLFEDEKPSPAGAGLWRSLAFWRSLSFGAAALAAVLAAVVLVGIPWQAAGPELVASLAAADSDAAFLAVKAGDGTIRITRTGVEPPAGRSHELWVIVPDRAPVSLGLVMASGTTDTTLPADIARMPDDALTLAVTLEPEGGAPNGVPTGPVIAAGQLKRI